MAIIKWDPFQDMDRFFDDRFFPMPRASARTSFGDLAVDLYEEGENVIAKMTLPGIDAKNLDVSVENNMLRVSGSREEEKEEKGKSYYSKEISRGSFSRVVSLPKIVDAGKVKASYKDGVLQVTMPVAKGEKKSSVKVDVKK